MKGVIFFDIGNVLVKFSHERMYRQIANYCEIDFQQIHEFFIKQNHGENYELGKISSYELFEKISKITSKKIDFAELMRAGSDIFEENVGMSQLIKKLKASNHRLVLLSNTCEAHFQHGLKDYPIIQQFDEKILSFEINLRKPDPEIYLLALKISEGFPSFYTDDIPEFVKTANSVGLDGVVFQSPRQLYADLITKKFLN